MNTRALIALLTACLVFSLTSFSADSIATEKQQYWLLNPAPEKLLRPLASDDADLVTSPYTVDAGHFQVESHLIAYSYDEMETIYTTATIKDVQEQYVWAPNFKVGLCNRTDFEVRAGYYLSSYESTLSTGGMTLKNRSSSDGFTSVQPRFKINIWGNDEGKTALAIVPTLTIPTEGHSDVTGGIGIPFSVSLPSDFSLKLYSEGSWYENYQRTLYMNFANKASITKKFAPRIEGFASFLSNTRTQPDVEWTGFTGFGAKYALVPNMQLHAGVMFGVTDNTYDYNPYMGFAWRY